MGNSKIRPTQNPRLLTDHRKICHRWLCLWPIRLCQIWWKSAHGELLREMDEICHFFYLWPFFRKLSSRTQSDLSMDFHACWLKLRAFEKGCAFGGFVDIARHFGGEMRSTWCWVILLFNDFCCFWSVAVNTMNKLQCLIFMFAVLLPNLCNVSFSNTRKFWSNYSIFTIAAVRYSRN